MRVTDKTAPNTRTPEGVPARQRPTRCVCDCCDIFFTAPARILRVAPNVETEKAFPDGQGRIAVSAPTRLGARACPACRPSAGRPPGRVLSGRLLLPWWARRPPATRGSNGRGCLRCNATCVHCDGAARPPARKTGTGLCVALRRAVAGGGRWRHGRCLGLSRLCRTRGLFLAKGTCLTSGAQQVTVVSSR